MYRPLAGAATDVLDVLALLVDTRDHRYAGTAADLTTYRDTQHAALSAQLGSFAAGEEVTLRIAFDNVFRPDRYYATPAIAHAGTGFAWIDRRERFAEVVVTGASRTDAIIDLPYEVAVDRGRVDRPRTEVVG